MSGERDDYSERCDQHEEVAREYIKHETIAQTRYEDLIKEYKEARSVLISSGAFKVDDDGNIILGWYNKPSKESDGAKVGVAAGVASVLTGIGAPVTAWTLVGAFGTASTGAAIGGLYWGCRNRSDCRMVWGRIPSYWRTWSGSRAICSIWHRNSRRRRCTTDRSHVSGKKAERFG